MNLPRWGSRPIQIIFGGTGGLLSYFLGISSYLQKNFSIIRRKEPVYSSISGGAIPSLLLTHNYPIDKFHQETLLPNLNILGQKWMGPIGNFYPQMIPALDQFLEKEKFDLSRLEGKYYLKASRLEVSSLNWKFSPVLLSSWKTRNDLLYAIQSTANLYLLGNGLSETPSEILYDGTLTGSKTDLKDYFEIPFNLKTIHIHTHIVRKYTWLDHWLWTNTNWHLELFEKGFRDAQEVSDFENLN